MQVLLIWLQGWLASEGMKYGDSMQALPVRCRAAYQPPASDTLSYKSIGISWLQPGRTGDPYTARQNSRRAASTPPSGAPGGLASPRPRWLRCESCSCELRADHGQPRAKYGCLGALDVAQAGERRLLLCLHVTAVPRCCCCSAFGWMPSAVTATCSGSEPSHSAAPWMYFHLGRIPASVVGCEHWPLGVVFYL
jgi:hypothetical protein